MLNRPDDLLNCRGERNVKRIFKNPAFIGKGSNGKAKGIEGSCFRHRRSRLICCRSFGKVRVGNFALFDADKVCLTNINRQIIATRKTIGRVKVEVAAERIKEINPNAGVETHQVFTCLKMRMNMI